MAQYVFVSLLSRDSVYDMLRRVCTHLQVWNPEVRVELVDCTQVLRGGCYGRLACLSSVGNGRERERERGECRGSEHQRLFLDLASLSIFWFVLGCAHVHVCPHPCLLGMQTDRSIQLLLNMSSGQGEEGEVGRGRGIEEIELAAWDLPLYSLTK